MNSLIKKMSAITIAVGMLMTNVSYLQTTSLIATAIEMETSDAEETVHIWDGTTDVSWYDDEETEFHISTPEQLAGMAAIVNTGKTMEGKTFILDNDIYLNDVSTYDEWETTPPENEWISFKEFSGTFQGDNYSIIGMYSTSSGLFQYVNNGNISGVYLNDIYIHYSLERSHFISECSFATNIGCLINHAENSLIEKCYVQGTINSKETVTVRTQYTVSHNSGYPEVEYVAYIGGVIGKNDLGKIIDCYSNANVSHSSNCNAYYKDINGKTSSVGVSMFEYIGGICGYASSTTINCINDGNIKGENIEGKTPFIGGICGKSDDVIKNCKNCGEIGLMCLEDSKSNRTSNEIGGICGTNSGRVLDCYNIAEVQGNGICGTMSNGIIENVYNTGKATDGYAICNNRNTLTINAYYLSGTALEGGPNTTAKTEANMKKESFADSLGSAFYYVEGEYPKLAFEVGRTVSNFDKTSLSFKEYGETQTLTLDTTYLGTPEWISSDSSVATVDENGVVTAVGNGTAMIYALCSDSKAACSVSVGYDYYLSDNELSLKKGRIHDVAVYSASTNEKVMDTEIEWSSSDDSVVSVDGEGKLTANNKGTAVVTAKIADMELSCIVSVYEYTIPVIPSEDDENAPKLSETEFSISTIESKKLSVMNYADSITWVSSNTAITKVNDQGLVRAVAEGQAAIYALLSDGKCLKADVTVTKSEYSMGDVNLDGKFDVADVVLLQKWLLAIPDTELKHWENADFYEDGILNVFDLCMMREQLIS